MKNRQYLPYTQISPPKWLVALTVLLLLGGCATRSKYVAFAESGVTFNRAMLQVSESANRIATNTESEILLSRMPGRSQDQRAAYLADADAIDAESIKTMRSVDEISRAMLEYFQALSALASTTAPEKIGTEVNEAGNNLTDISKKLGGTGTTITAATPLVTSGTTFIANLGVDRALKDELDSRTAALDLAFQLQQNLLDRLSKETEENAETLVDKRRDRIVRQPYVTGSLHSTAAQNAWIEERANLALVPYRVAAIGEAKKQMKEMQDNFMALQKGEMSAEDIDRFTGQLVDFIAKLKSLQSATDAK
jgi:hypothetical protein